VRAKRARPARRADALARATLLSVIKRNPNVLAVLHDHGVHFCSGCFLTLSAPLAKAAAWHAVPDLDLFLKDMERALKSKPHALLG